MFALTDSKADPRIVPYISRLAPTEKNGPLDLLAKALKELEEITEKQCVLAFKLYSRKECPDWAKEVLPLSQCLKSHAVGITQIYNQLPHITPTNTLAQVLQALSLIELRCKLLQEQDIKLTALFQSQDFAHALSRCKEGFKDIAEIESEKKTRLEKLPISSRPYLREELGKLFDNVKRLYERENDIQEITITPAKLEELPSESRPFLREELGKLFNNIKRLAQRENIQETTFIQLTPSSPFLIANNAFVEQLKKMKLPKTMPVEACLQEDARALFTLYKEIMKRLSEILAGKDAAFGFSSHSVELLLYDNVLMKLSLALYKQRESPDSVAGLFHIRETIENLLPLIQDYLSPENESYRLAERRIFEYLKGSSSPAEELQALYDACKSVTKYLPHPEHSRKITRYQEKRIKAFRAILDEHGPKTLLKLMPEFENAGPLPFHFSCLAIGYIYFHNTAYGPKLKELHQIIKTMPEDTLQAPVFFREFFSDEEDSSP
jgi:hypothetical protein